MGGIIAGVVGGGDLSFVKSRCEQGEGAAGIAANRQKRESPRVSKKQMKRNRG